MRHPNHPSTTLKTALTTRTHSKYLDKQDIRGAPPRMSCCDLLNTGLAIPSTSYFRRRSDASDDRRPIASKAKLLGSGTRKINVGENRPLSLLPRVSATANRAVDRAGRRRRIARVRAAPSGQRARAIRIPVVVIEQLPTGRAGNVVNFLRVNEKIMIKKAAGSCLHHFRGKRPSTIRVDVCLAVIVNANDECDRATPRIFGALDQVAANFRWDRGT